MPVPGIQSIRNVTVYHAFDNSVGTFTTTINSLPSTQADEVVIRAISWHGVPDDLNTYLIWSNLNNDFIGSISGGGSASSCPGTRIILNGVIPNQLEFRLMVPGTADNPPQQLSNVDADICMHMDFITYQRVH